MYWDILKSNCPSGLGQKIHQMQDAFQFNIIGITYERK